MPDPPEPSASPQPVAPEGEVRREYEDLIALELAISVNEVNGWTLKMAGRDRDGYWARSSREDPDAGAGHVR